jgi:hypothetical protein
MDPPRNARPWLAIAGGALVGVFLAWLITTVLLGTATPSGTREQLGGVNEPLTELDQAEKATVSGTVRDHEGKPIADANVCASPNVAELQGFGDRTLRCVYSNSDGSFRIDHLWPVGTSIHASAKGFKPAREEYRDEAGQRQTQLPLRPGETVERIELELHPDGVPITGVVRDIGGNEVAGALISDSSGQATAVAVSDDTGRFELWTEPGSVRIAVTADGYIEGTLSTTAPGFVELYMAPESVLVGRAVHADSGEPVQNALVYAHGKTTRTDASGRFRIGGLEPDTYYFRAEARGPRSYFPQVIHLGFHQVSEEFVIYMHPAAQVVGKVVVVDTGRPCTRGAVHLRSGWLNYVKAELDDEGTAKFPAVLPGTYDVDVTCEDHASYSYYPAISVKRDIGGLVWGVREGLALEGEIVDERGEPIGSVPLRAEPIDPETGIAEYSSRHRARSKSDGSFRLLGLRPTQYQISGDFFSARPGPIDPVVVDLENPGAGLRIVIPSVGMIRGRVVDNETGAPVVEASIFASLRNGDWRHMGVAHSNETGEFQIADIARGYTEISAHDRQDRWPRTKVRQVGKAGVGDRVEVIANTLVEIEVTVEFDQGWIAGILLDEDGETVASALVIVHSEWSSPSWRDLSQIWNSQAVLTDADGRFELDGLPDGHFIVRAYRLGGGEARVDDVELGNHVELTFMSTGELAG